MHYYIYSAIVKFHGHEQRAGFFLAVAHVHALGVTDDLGRRQVGAQGQRGIDHLDGAEPRAEVFVNGPSATVITVLLPLATSCQNTHIRKTER